MKKPPKIPEEQVGLYDRSTHKPIKIHTNVKYPAHYQTFNESHNMSLTTLKELGANVKTLVWEYICSNMDYENIIQPNVTELADIIGAHRTHVSDALTEMEKGIFIIQLEASKGRHGRKFMIDPYRVNRGSATELPKKRALWNKLVKDQFEENKPKMSNDNVIDFPGDFN